MPKSSRRQTQESSPELDQTASPRAQDQAAKPEDPGVREGAGSSADSSANEPAVPDAQAGASSSANSQPTGLVVSDAPTAGPSLRTRIDSAPIEISLPGTDQAEPESDPFDLESLRLPQDFATAVEVERPITTIPVGKPSNEVFFRIRQDPAYQLQAAILELKEDREIYLVAGNLRSALTTEKTVSSRLVVVGITRQATLFVWPIRLPDPDGRIDSWSQSALAIAAEAQTRWVRMVSDHGIRAYRPEFPKLVFPDPNWPPLSLQAIIRIAFRDKLIDRWDHHVLRRLRGEV
jgi:hypothetical protein